MSNVPSGAALAAAHDKYWVYRPVLDLSEGTDKGRGYNETLGYGAYTGGPVDLVRMTLKQVDDLEGKMLAHPKNKLNSSAGGRYQIVRTTRGNIQKALSIPAATLFDRGLQDRMGCYLLGQRGMDKWLSGRMSRNKMLGNLAREWASLPTSAGKGYYGGQRASVTVMQVTAALTAVRQRHEQGQPKFEVRVMPAGVETKVKERVDWWTKLTGGGGVAGLGMGAVFGMSWQTILAGGADCHDPATGAAAQLDRWGSAGVS